MLHVQRADNLLARSRAQYVQRLGTWRARLCGCSVLSTSLRQGTREFLNRREVFGGGRKADVAASGMARSEQNKSGLPLGHTADWMKGDGRFRVLCWAADGWIGQSPSDVLLVNKGFEDSIQSSIH